MKILYLFRKSTTQFNSIETVFSGLINHLYDCITPNIRYCPSSRANLYGIVKNSLFSFKFRNNIIHITGHVNYLAIFTGKKTILSIHDVGSYKKNNWLKSRIFNFLWIKAPVYFSNKVIVISDFSRQEVLNIYPSGKGKLRVIPNPVNKEFIKVPYSFNSFSPKILLVGTKLNKNLNRVISAIEGLTCELIILGELKKEVILLLEKKQIGYTSRFNLSFEEVIATYAESDLLCFCSVYEGFGLPILEAQATGRPVITSNLGAMKEVAGESACLVDPYDIDSIRAGIEKVIHNDEFRESLISKGFENVKRFSIHEIANQYYSLYKEVDES